MKGDFIFVYGTLRKQVNSVARLILNRYATYICDAYMQGKFYEVDGYPGAVESNDVSDQIKGEIYRINNPMVVLSHLDDYEECSAAYPSPHEYSREKIEVFLEDGKSVFAWTYLYNRSISILKPITSGDYLAGLTER